MIIRKRDNIVDGHLELCLGERAVLGGAVATQNHGVRGKRELLLDLGGVRAIELDEEHLVAHLGGGLLKEREDALAHRAILGVDHEHDGHALQKALQGSGVDLRGRVGALLRRQVRAVRTRRGNIPGDIKRSMLGALCALHTRISQLPRIRLDKRVDIIPAGLKVLPGGAAHKRREEASRLGDGLSLAIGNGARERVDAARDKVGGEARVAAEEIHRRGKREVVVGEARGDGGVVAAEEGGAELAEGGLARGAGGVRAGAVRGAHGGRAVCAEGGGGGQETRAAGH